MNLDFKTIKTLFSENDFSRGMKYAEQGRVLSLQKSIKNGTVSVSCVVIGSEMYRVKFQLLPNGTLLSDCNCPRFDRMGTCKHLAAAMVSYTGFPQPHGGDRYTAALLQQYMQKVKREESPDATTSAHLVPQFYFKGDHEYPAISFRVGTDKLYVVKNIREFLRHVDQRNTVYYGKKLTLDHSIEHFDTLSQTMIHMLMDIYEESHHTGYSGTVYYPRDYTPNAVTLTGETFDRWFTLLQDSTQETINGVSIQLRQEDPAVCLRVEKEETVVQLEIQTPCPYQFFGNRRSLYAYGDNALLRCSDAFLEQVYPLLESGRQYLYLTESDMPTFCSCVLPQIADFVEIEDSHQLFQHYLPEECTPCFYFDLQDDTLSLRLAYRYGTQEFSPYHAPSVADGVRRDVKTEINTVRMVQRYMQKSDDVFTLTGEDEVFPFLAERLETFQQYGEVYLTDRLRKKRITPTSVRVGLSVSDGMLALSFDTGDFPPEELSALYQSLLLRKKYHRLADGRYMILNGSPCETMAEAAQMLQLSPRELSRQQITLPTYRGLYLNNVLGTQEGIQIYRDKPFRSMIRNFKTLSESDTPLPTSLETVLRPYQKIGFQWLKTLESYGFGGILADEMGLGKTLQVIAFLSTVPYTTVGHPNLVVCPASLIYNWGDELQKFAPRLSFCLILGSASERKDLRANAVQSDVWVTSYELLRQDIEDYTQQEFYCCILDEAQHIKNAATQISKAVKRIVCRQRFVLTGTPIENRLSELWNLFDFLMSGYLYTHSAFREKLEKPILRAKNPEASDQLRRLVQPFLLRRLKSDVLKELPPKEEHIHRISLSEEEQKTYYSCVQSTLETLHGTQGKLQILAALTRLRQICCDPNLVFENYSGQTSKLDACIELCEAMVENGHQILIFSQFTSMLSRIRIRLEEQNIRSFTLQGSTSKETRARLVKAFHAGEASVFLISLKAGGTGLNLTTADVVIHYDPWWNQAAQNQATDRAHRIGQQEQVQVYKLIAKDTIEEQILALQDKKAALMDTISGAENGGILDMSTEELLALLHV